MIIVCDTNILLRTAEPLHPMHATAVGSTALLRSRGPTLAVFPQGLQELWVVATRPTAVNGLGLSVAEADAEVSRFEREFTLFPDHPATFGEWRGLVVRHAVKGKPAHDARIVAAMCVHAVTHLLTFNDADFRRYPGITVLTPAGVLAGSHP